MARTGRPPKSIEAHIRDGTLESRHRTKLPLVVGGRRKPTYPSRLGPKGLFDFLVDEMWTAGVLDRADMPMVLVAARLWNRVVQADKEIRVHGYTLEVPRGYRGCLIREVNPAVASQREDLRALLHCCELLGVGPSARARLASLGVKTSDATAERDVPGLATLRLLQGGPPKV